MPGVLLPILCIPALAHDFRSAARSC